MKRVKDIRESYNLVTEKEEADLNKLTSLVRAGLFDAKKLPILKRILQKDVNKMTPAEKKILIELLDSLMSEVLHSQQVFSKVKQNVSHKDLNEAKDYLSKFDPRFGPKQPTEGDLPAVLILKRKAIRVYPDQQKVALYYSQALDRYISIPFDNITYGMNEETASLDEKTKDDDDDEDKKKKDKYGDFYNPLTRQPFREKKRYDKLMNIPLSRLDPGQGGPAIERKNKVLRKAVRGAALKSVGKAIASDDWQAAGAAAGAHLGALARAGIGKLISSIKGRKGPIAQKPTTPPSAPKPVEKSSSLPSISTKITQKMPKMAEPMSGKVSFKQAEKPKSVETKQPSKKMNKIPGTGEQPSAPAGGFNFSEPAAKTKTFSYQTATTGARELSPLEKSSGKVDPKKQIPRKRYGFDPKPAGVGPQPDIGKTKIKAAFLKKLNERKEYDVADAALDAASFVPGPVGSVASLASAGRSVSKGDYLGAALDVAGAIPLVGYAAKGAKVARVAKKTSDASKVADKASDATKAAKEAGEEIAAKTAKETSTEVSTKAAKEIGTLEKAAPAPKIEAPKVPPAPKVEAPKVTKAPEKITDISTIERMSPSASRGADVFASATKLGGETTVKQIGKSEVLDMVRSNLALAAKPKPAPMTPPPAPKRAPGRRGPSPAKPGRSPSREPLKPFKPATKPEPAPAPTPKVPSVPKTPPAPEPLKPSPAPKIPSTPKPSAPPAPKPQPAPAPAPQPAPQPAPKPVTSPVPKTKPAPQPTPAPKEVPLPSTSKAPSPAPKPSPATRGKPKPAPVPIRRRGRDFPDLGLPGSDTPRKFSTPLGFKLQANLGGPKEFDPLDVRRERERQFFFKSLKEEDEDTIRKEVERRLNRKVYSKPKSFGTLKVQTSTPKGKSTDTVRSERERQAFMQSNRAYDDISEMSRNDIKESAINIAGNQVIINNTIANKIVNVYESLDKDNKQKMREMLGESVDSFKKIVNFAVRQ